ncbi:conserved hypothetical protein [Vibrio nigripulchritudo SFn27]|uniref:Uncharacterized protein n=1 Tax=Vibrio nigripulchritudo TaxID=28173 RepID=U4JZC3_9VIBR|nr:hypothetical protein [Vibrio nigripulchritudo]CCN82735.1 conserved hypothetical protein [Vibrio nigripulchritudo BLFn1]CCN89885.1 conserved hypothetical protein [Vibrio nigripulchritudo SFn27]CCN92282.1 conserved hypothetical protein [Vibrio nigripulchritudo ENn2]CCO43769.1 conserved hypothetical protein [Vibrio nigripulchritudo SFn135]CCO53083.1 conserved hypothetical protein [Vibrio nigripulchritudo Wn13]
MTLNKQYSIATRQQRSTRIDSDLSPEFFQGLVYHGTAQSALETLFRQYSQTGQSAYTLTGPYGSGKSTIALLLTGLLHENPKLRNAALEVVNQESKDLLDQSVDYSKGWLQIRSVGGINSPVNTFWSATLNALLEHPATKQLHDKYNSVEIKSESHLIEIWESLFAEMNTLVDGVLLLADEMGKNLEFINKNRGELHLFQELAEVLGRIDTRVIFVGLLHQAFSEYAKDRGTKLQEEWSKIQGRYNDILYNVSTDEAVALIGKSITHTKSIDNSDDSVVLQVLNALGEDKSERKKQLKQRLQQCVPLHPLTALLLGPISKRRFSQNERSTFSFLNSHEQNSFQMFLKENANRDARYTLEHLWDYLEVNLEHTILGSPDGHGWAAATESIRQATKKQVPEKAVEILKSIALITLFGKPANLSATEEILLAASAISDREELNEYLQNLKSASCIIYRKHLSSWVVFEGSDIDIPSLIEDKIEQQGKSNEAINHIVFSKQIIAKGYYHKVGTLRWAEQSISYHFDDELAKRLIGQRKGEFANMVLLLNQTDDEKLREVSKQHPTLILASAKSSDEITALAKELYALELIKSDKKVGATLQHDNVAQKEYNGRLLSAEIALDNAINEAFDNADWYCFGQRSEHKTLSAIVSETAGRVFNATPVIMNELVNRNKLSGTAVSALKKLLEAMLDEEDEENLGITGHPPEMSMYISCLKKTAIHTFEAENERHWHYDANIDPKLKTLFDAASNYLVENAGRNVRLSEIVSLWSNAPYGITQGVTPIFLLAFLKSLGNDVAFYEKDLGGEYAFIAGPDVDYVHKLIKSPQELAVKYIVLDEAEREWLQFLASFTATETNRDVTNNILSVATPLVTTMHNLPNWVKNAHNFDADITTNKKLISVRDLFLQANDPHALLIVDLPKYLDPKSELTFNQKIDVLESYFKVLRSKHELMLKAIKKKVKTLFPENGDGLKSMCQLVEQKAGDLRLKAFARELGKSEDGLLEWLESMIQIVIGRGKQSWNEGLLLSASTKISEFAQDFLSVVKSSDTPQEKQVLEVRTKLVSLVLEDNDGQLNSYKKEVRITDQENTENQIKNVERTLKELEMDEFERIHVLQTLLKQALEAQG